MAKNNIQQKESKTAFFQGLTGSKVEKLVGDVIHKVKNNLGGISGFATLLSRDIGDESPHQRLIEQIQNSVMRLDDLVVDLMVLIRKNKTHREDVSLKPLVTDIIAQYEDRNHLKCKVIYQATEKQDKLIVDTDPFLIERVFLYLIRFVEYAKGILKEIIITSTTDKTIRIEAYIHHIEIDQCPEGDLATLITDYEPVEARLTFAILVKLVNVLQGKIQGICESQNHLKLTIDLS